MFTVKKILIAVLAVLLLTVLILGATNRLSQPGLHSAAPSPAAPSPAAPSPAEPSPAEPSPAEASPAEPSPAEPSPAASEPTALNYDDPGNWAYFALGEDKPVDVFLIGPTVDMSDENNMDMSNDKLKRSFEGALNMQRGIYEDSGRLFAPYYRQMAMKGYSLEPEERAPYLAFAYDDISDAFSWYLEHENNGRPIVLAGFSQGADMCYRVLQEFFGDQDLYDRLVAVYAIGWPCEKSMADRFPQIKPATGVDDIGAVVSFECEAPEVTSSMVLPADIVSYSINPLNWRTDSTPADKSENPGAVFTKKSGEIVLEVPGLCGCYIDEPRGALKVTDILSGDYPPGIEILPEGAYHLFDYQFFYRALQQNVQTRVEAYLGQIALPAAA